MKRLPTLAVRFVLLMMCVCLITPQAQSQSRKGLTGIGVRIGTVPPGLYSTEYSFNNIEMQPDIIIPMWVSDRIKLEPSLGIYSMTGFTFWRVGMSVASHLSDAPLSPFTAFRANMLLYSGGGATSKDFILGIAAGEEYFCADRVSISGEVQLNYFLPDKSNSYNSRKNSVFTGACLAARFYFK